MEAMAETRSAVGCGGVGNGRRIRSDRTILLFSFSSEAKRQLNDTTINFTLDLDKTLLVESKRVTIPHTIQPASWLVELDRRAFS